MRRLDRVSFLHYDDAADGLGRAHEAQAAAALDHPNICTVHEIDEAKGQTFIAMAYIEGLGRFSHPLSTSSQRYSALRQQETRAQS